MNMPIDKEWFEKRAAAEGDLEIGAGLPTYVPPFIPSEADRYYGAVIARLHAHIAELEAKAAPKNNVASLPIYDASRPFSDSVLPLAMIQAGADVLERCDLDLENATGPDWDYGMEAVAVYRAMCAAALSSTTEGSDRG